MIRQSFGVKYDSHEKKRLPKRSWSFLPKFMSAFKVIFEPWSAKKALSMSSYCALKKGPKLKSSVVSFKNGDLMWGKMLQRTPRAPLKLNRWNSEI